MEDQIMLEREIRQKFDRIIAEMEWGEVVSTLNEMLAQMLTPDELAELERTAAQPAESQVGGCDKHQPVPLYSEAGASSREQYNNPPLGRLPEGSEKKLRCDGQLNGQLLHQLRSEVLPPPACAPPAKPTSTLKKCKRKQKVDPQYIKKPPNAFMLFVKEQRSNVEAEVWIRGSAAVNTTLGQRWKSLTDKEKEKYYKQAQKEKELHAQQHPGWTSKNSYGKKKKGRRQRKASTVKASASVPMDKRLLMIPHPHIQTGVMNIPHLQKGVMEPITVLQLPPSWIPSAAPLHLLYPPQMYKVQTSSWQNAFPAAPNNGQ